MVVKHAWYKTHCLTILNIQFPVMNPQWVHSQVVVFFQNFLILSNKHSFSLSGWHWLRALCFPALD